MSEIFLDSENAGWQPQKQTELMIESGENFLLLDIKAY